MREKVRGKELRLASSILLRIEVFSAGDRQALAYAI